MFLDYFASPYRTSKHIHPFQNQIDFNNRRAIVLDGVDDARISLISARDFCAVVARAIEYEGEWPVTGGIRGDELAIGQLVTIGEKIRTLPVYYLEVICLSGEELVADLSRRRSVFNRESAARGSQAWSGQDDMAAEA